MAIDYDNNPPMGIDLGTTFSAIACWNGRGTRIYQNNGDNTTQSVVYFHPKTKQIIVGKTAYNQGLTDPQNMVIGVKRKMDNHNERIVLGEKEYSPIEISAEILKKIYSEAQKSIPGLRTRGTVVTVPYYFKAHQCDNTRKAAELADVECRTTLQEPIAASLSYAWQRVQEYPDREGEETFLVFDLGGGTFDLTLFKLIQSKDKLVFEVLASGGDDRLGGLDFDERLAELILEKSKIDLTVISDDKTKRVAWQKLMENAVFAKMTLSASTVTDISIPYLIASPETHILDMQISRREFEDCISRYTDKIKEILSNIWGTAGIKPEQVDRVILVGGSSRIPCMRDLLTGFVGDNKIYANTDASLCVAEGAALYAAYLDDREVFGREIEVRTRTCHSLGLEIAGGEFFTLIGANRKTPCEHRQTFTTDKDNMTTLDINVYQGSSRLVKNNTLVGTINITGLPPRPRGQLDVDVTFRVSEDQTVSVIVEAGGNRKAASLRFA